MEEFRAARTAVLQAERNLAAAKGEEYVVPIEFPVCWDTGAPLPYLLQNDRGVRDAAVRFAFRHLQTPGCLAGEISRYHSLTGF